jgi:hypothetical protein
VDKYIPLNLQTYINDFFCVIFDNRNSEERIKLDMFSRELFNKRHDIILHDTGNSFLAEVIAEMNKRMQALYDSNDAMPSLDLVSENTEVKDAAKQEYKEHRVAIKL